MPSCTVDGQSVQFKDGENLVEVAKRVGIKIPVFCYHPGLSVVAQCRMCTVEIEKNPKLQTACSTVAKEGMIVFTQSPTVKRNRQAVMEFLLINHPLDCPICDKSGECDLQDFSFADGSPYMRTSESRRTYVDLDMGSVIQKNMNRCIHCTRCIRFGDEIAKLHEMVALNRGNNVEISTIDGRPLETAYAGNYADICPTGSLTLKEFRFRKRVWYLNRTETVCEGCSRGCNMEIHHKDNRIYRCVPRENLEINRYWLCDEGRFNYVYVNSKSRIASPRAHLREVEWEEALREGIGPVKSGSKSGPMQKGKAVFLLGSDATTEEARVLFEFVQECYQGAGLFHFGTEKVLRHGDDRDEDQILKRTSKTANLNGLEELKIMPFEVMPKGTEVVFIFRWGRAVVPAIGIEVKQIGIGVFDEKGADRYRVILPGLSFAEKNGTIVNFKGVRQQFKQAIEPVGESKGLLEILTLWKSHLLQVGSGEK